MSVYKVVLAGNAGTGKTSLINRYVYETFDANARSTIGVEFSHKKLEGNMRMTFWDTAGQEKFKSMTSSYYRGAHAVMFVYDVADRQSFLGLEQWWREYNVYGNAQQSVALLVGNKTDCRRQVSAEDARAWAVQKNMCYEEVSAKLNDGIGRAFDTLIGQLRQLPQVRKETIQFKSAPKSDRCCF